VTTTTLATTDEALNPLMKIVKFRNRFGGTEFPLATGGTNQSNLTWETWKLKWKTATVIVVVLWATTAHAALRIVSYNIDDADQGNDNNITASYAGLPAALQAIGQHHIGTNAQPIDVLGVEELNSTTLTNLVNALNNIYGAGTYDFDRTTDPSTGGGTDGLIYNTHSIQVVSAAVIGTASTSGAARAPMRYLLRPIGFATNSDFYMYVSHYKASSGSANETRRDAEATTIRQDADGLGPTAHVIYSGDFNLTGASSEAAWTTLTTSGNGQAHDPTEAAGWTNGSGTLKYLYSESSTSLGSRYDFELVSSAVLNQPGVQLAADPSDPFTGNYPSSKYPYAYEVFGNNGTTALNGLSNDSVHNTSLSDLPNASAVLNDLMQPYSGNNQQFVGSDHLPIVADYDVTLLPGDLNNNGVVDAADYTVWRKGLGTMYVQADYNIWRAHFGQPPGSGAGTITNADVPEPATSMQIILVSAIISAGRRRRPHSRCQNSLTRLAPYRPTP
jgi:hypothetical protein